MAKYHTITEFGIDKILEPIMKDIKKLEAVMSNNIPYSRKFLRKNYA